MAHRCDEIVLHPVELLQAVVGDRQLLLLPPLTPLTYHVVLATAVEARARKTGANSKLVNSLRLIIFLRMKRFPKPGLNYLEARVALSAAIDGSALREDADRA